MYYVIHARNILANKRREVHCGCNGLLARQIYWGQQEEHSIALCCAQAVGFVAREVLYYPPHSPCTVRLVRINLVQSDTAMELNVQVALWQPYLFVSLLLPFLFGKEQWLRAVATPAGSKPGPALWSKAAFSRTPLSSPLCCVSVFDSIL